MNWIKYHAIKIKGMVTGKTVVGFFGKSYLISGNIVKRFG